MVKKLAHVAIATTSIERSLDFYRLLGLPVESIETVAGQGVKVALIPVGDSALELTEASASASPIARFLEKRGPGLHHIALEVEDLEGHLSRLKAGGIRLIDEEPQRGAAGRRIAFIHPGSTGGVLVELTERTEPDAVG